MDTGSPLLDDIRPIASVLRVFGLFPATFSKYGIQFSYNSPLAVASLFHVVICWGIPFTVKMSSSGMTMANKVQLIIYGLQLFIKGLPAALTFGIIPRLVESIINTDKFLDRSPKTANRMIWPVLSLSVYGVYLTITSFFLYSGTISSALTRPLVALIWHKEPQQLVLFAFFVYQLEVRFQIVREMLAKPEAGRLAHAALSNCLRTFSEAFELRMFVTVIAIGTDYLLNVYMNTYHQQAASSLTVLVGTLDGLSAVYLPAYLASRLIEKVYAVKEDLLELSLCGKNEEFCRQVNMFLEELRSSNLEITAWGVFSLDSGLYGSFVSTLMTFFIAMAQFTNEITALIHRYGLDT